MAIYETAKIYVEGFNAYNTGISANKNPYPLDGEDYDYWWEGWVDASESVVEYYEIAKGIVDSSSLA